MVIMPANDLILIRVWFFHNGIVDDHDTIRPFNLPHLWLDQSPPDLGRQLFTGQHAGDPVMADFTINQSG